MVTQRYATNHSNSQKHGPLSIVVLITATHVCFDRIAKCIYNLLMEMKI